MVRLVDVHCHLESEEFTGRLDEVIESARLAGVVALVTNAITPEQWPVSEAIAGRFSSVRFALGVHPWYAKEEHIEVTEGLRTARERGAVAIGEIGLDKKVESPPFSLQWEIFVRQLAIARDLGLPIIVHCRGAFNELVLALRQVGPLARGGIVHAFSGSVEIAAELMRYGMRFSMGGTLTYRNNTKRERVLRQIYPDHFLFESDAPDIPPVQARGIPNTPANILYALRAASGMLGISAEAIAEATTRNAAHVFGLEL